MQTRDTYEGVTFIALILLTGLSAMACGSTASVLVGPPCPADPPSTPRGGRLFTGIVPGEFTPDTQARAFGQALTEGLKEIGVEVSASTLMNATTEVLNVDGTESVVASSTESRDISITLETMEVRRAKTTYCSIIGDAPQVQAFVKIPGSEWLRLLRQSSGKTALVVGCSSTPEGGCRPEVLNATQNAAREAGFEVSHAELRDADELPNDRETIALSNQHGAAWVLIVSLRSRTLSGDDPVFAETTSLVRLVETSDGTTIRTWEPGRHASNNQPHRFKGSAFREHSKTPEADALSQSLQRAIVGSDRGRPCAADDTFCSEPGVLQGMKAWEPWR